MKTVAIIAEYNPFHNGHMYQIKETRRIFGEDTAIIAIMSGNYTQRGEPAIADKTLRAKVAVECGVDLVIELPFPFCVSSAEFYATAGVSIADSLGVVDYLLFGSECGDIDRLKGVAKNTLSDEFSNELEKLRTSVEYRDMGYPALAESVYKKLYGDSCSDILSAPNNTLAVEYIKAIIRLGSNIKPFTVKRVGAGYSEELNLQKEFQSATAIRKMLLEKDYSALDYVPKTAKDIYLKSIESKDMPADATKLDSAVIAHFRLNSPVQNCDIHDAAGGLYNRLCDGGRKTNSIQALLSTAETKKYTSSRIMRVIWYSYFGVTSSTVRNAPAYAQVLAVNEVGRGLLRRISKMTDFPIITKPSAFKAMSDTVIRQKELANSADSVYQLTLNRSNEGNFPLTFTPYVKK